MATRINIIRFRCGLNATVPASVVELNLGYTPRVLGENLASRQLRGWLRDAFESLEVLSLQKR